MQHTFFSVIMASVKLYDHALIHANGFPFKRHNTNGNVWSVNSVSV